MKKKEKSFFDEEDRLKRLSEIGDPLEKLNKIIEWEMFRNVITKACRKEDAGKGGRPAFDVILMFKILVLKRLYNLSYDNIEYQINDRMSFMRFLGLNLCDTVPDSRTIWKFENDLTEEFVIDDMFDMFTEMLKSEGLITHKGTIIDATFVDAPRQRNTREENAAIKEGKIPEEWKTPENANKLAQKDTDARWTKKGNETHYGYKDHVKCDADSKLITDYRVSDASLHDSQASTEMLDENDKAFYADSAYASQEIAENLPENCENKICEKGYRDHPLTKEQKENNRKKSKIRSRIEHIFGFMTGSMNAITVRTIGFDRAYFNIGITNLIYNFCRYEILKRPKQLSKNCISAA